MMLLLLLLWLMLLLLLLWLMLLLLLSLSLSLSWSLSLLSFSCTARPSGQPNRQAVPPPQVSRERVYTELTGMLSGAAPARSVTLLHAAGLLPVVFASPPGLPHPTGWADRAMALVRRMTALDPATATALVGAGAGAGAAGGAALGGTREGPALAALSPEQRRLAFLAGVLVPLAGLQFQQGKKQVTSTFDVTTCAARTQVAPWAGESRITTEGG